MREGERVRYDADIRVAGGSLMTIDFLVVPMCDDQQQITHLIASGVDVSDRKQAEAALSEREQFYRQLIEGMPLLTWTCLPDGTCDYICARWEKFAGEGTDPLVHSRAWSMSTRRIALRFARPGAMALPTADRFRPRCAATQ